MGVGQPLTADALYEGEPRSSSARRGRFAGTTTLAGEADDIIMKGRQHGKCKNPDDEEKDFRVSSDNDVNDQGVACESCAFPPKRLLYRILRPSIAILR